MYRDPATGNLQEVSSDVNFTFINTYSQEYVKGEPVRAILKPVDNQEGGKYSIIINKFAKSTKELITDSSARFKVKFISDGETKFETEIGTYETNNGRISQAGLKLPDEDGKYKIEITEVSAPVGYAIINKPIVVNITVGKNSEGNMVIKKAQTDSNDAEILYKHQLLYLNVFDYTEEEIQEDEYSLDITKVDAQTRLPIEDMSVLKVWLPDANNTAVYAETSQTSKGPGKLDYCYIERDKDYSVRLSHMNKPQVPGTVEYTFREILPPEGYQRIKEDLKLTLTFDYGEDGKLWITNAVSSNPYYLRINTPLPAPTNQNFSVDILNYEEEEDDLYLKSTEYFIGQKVGQPTGFVRGNLSEYKTGDEYISKVDPRTTLADFISNLDTNGTPVVTKPDGTPVGMNEWVGTGMTLTVTKGDKQIQITIVVTGDVSGEGEVTLQDFAVVRQLRVRELAVEDLQTPGLLAIDFDEDGGISLSDFSEELGLYYNYL